MAAARRQARAVPIVELHIELESIEPVVWRRVRIPANLTLGRLHRVIQAAMGWTDSHLHEFVIANAHFAIPDEEDDFLPYPVLPEARVRLDAALGERRHFDYLYDFGDSWEHKLRIERRLAPAPLAHPVCVDGENACPPEDVGGTPGYADFLSVIADPSDPEHEYTMEWCGGDFDPARFDIEQANRLLKRIKL